MIIIITGATHVGKTLLAQRLMEKLHMSYYSQDHIKMGLIRSGYSSLTPDVSDEIMTEYLWPVTREIVKTAIENKQNLIIEGCYIPFTWENDFDDLYLQEIKYICLCFSEKYIDSHYADIMKYEGRVESRIDDEYCTVELLKKENKRFFNGCKVKKLPCAVIDDDYELTVEDVIAEL